MSNEEIRIQIIKQTQNLLDNPDALWHRLFNLNLCTITSIDNQVFCQNSLFTLTLVFIPETPLNMNIDYSLKNNRTKEITKSTQGRVQNVIFFINQLNNLINEHMSEIIFHPQVDWELLNLVELQTIVVPKIRILKSQIRNFNDNDYLDKQLLIESKLYEIREKLTQISDPEVKQYAALIDLFET